MPQVIRIIDALEELPKACIDTLHLAVTSRSFAGTIALYAGAFNERIRLTTLKSRAAAAPPNWRVSDDRSRGTDAEDLHRAEHGLVSARPRPVQYLHRSPFHHIRSSAWCRRALLAIDTSSRLSHLSTFTSWVAMRQTWQALGVLEHMVVTQMSTNHGNFPASQRADVERSSMPPCSTRKGGKRVLLKSDAITTGVQLRGPERAQRLSARSASTSDMGVQPPRSQ